MLPEELAKAIRRLHIRSRRLVDTLTAGPYRSVFRGSGVEFEEVREYCPGDEVKHIDWRVSARMGRPFVKLHREERERIMMLLVDLSSSGRFGTGDRLKREKATELAAILAFNAIRSNDRVGAILFTDRVEHLLPPNKGPVQVWRLMRELLTAHPQGRGTDLGCALNLLDSLRLKRAIVFIVSDFIGPDCGRGLKLAARRHELIAVLISDPGEKTLPAGGLITVEDLENGSRTVVNASNHRLRECFRQRAEADLNRRIEMLRGAGVDCVALTTDASPVVTLNRYFRSRQQHLR